MLMKLTPVVNFINILRAAFAPILQSQIVIREKLLKTLLYKKIKRKMLLKLTPRVNLRKLLYAYLGTYFNEIN